MVWVRLDDHFDEHPKIARLDDHALALFVCGLAYSNRNLTDGFIPEQVGQGQLRYCEGDTRPAIRQLERVGMWEKIDGGWQIHDFPQYQPSRAAVLAERAADAARKSAKRRSPPRTPPRTPAGIPGTVHSGHVADNARIPGLPVPVNPLSTDVVVVGGNSSRTRAHEGLPIEVIERLSRPPIGTTTTTTDS